MATTGKQTPMMRTFAVAIVAAVLMSIVGSFLAWLTL